MKDNHLWNLLGHDVSRGIIHRWKSLLIACLLFSIICFSLIRGFSAYCTQFGYDSSLGVSEFLFNISAGKKPFSLDNPTAIKFPISWLSFHALLAYVVGFYTSEDLKKDAANFMLRVKSRTQWWFSKLLWCFITVLIYYLLFLIIAIVFSLIFGNPVFEVNIPFCEQYFPFLSKDILSQPVLITTFLIPLITSVVLSLLQITLCLFCRPIIAYICMLVYMIISTYICHASVLYNFTMVCRQQLIMNGMSFLGIIAFLIICINIIGFVRIRKIDVC